jgi:Ribbon-helix-helix protein, copG family
MATRHLSIRLEDSTFDRLDERSRQSGQSRSYLAQALLEEGLRMDAHPGIVFRSGPAGRRAALATGPDVWEVARVLKGLQGAGEDKLVEATELTGLHVEQLRIVSRYYAEYRDEIDDWLRRLDEEADRAEAAWEREQEILRA